jgi:hypothetical protein
VQIRERSSMNRLPVNSVRMEILLMKKAPCKVVSFFFVVTIYESIQTVSCQIFGEEIKEMQVDEINLR